eukprot:CAMPEP_0206444224 /NCGR_PEP_ID=MMETSP0324_2-20121206/14796_1 /ASSEMBLY_ACC=CAM_ASM_000836 /TAXON_ID=2866 /ORGANISM="Crypthecodinium cohnii, Strain Seligo" /LENGTH=429 /DNA_ID=CAMNT_0053912229 /DNA_START=89 /DNA_END=1378 /DNA_ORIENTATION=+
MVTNSAFLFIKPHAVTDKVKELVKEMLEKKSFKIVKEGSLEAEEIDKSKKIDKHYYAIASKATILTPDKLAVPADKFKEKFGLEWSEVLKEGKALNAMDCCSKFEIDSEELDKMWGACKKAGDLVKFGGGFYCGKLTKEGKGTYYVFNGFFMSMRSKYVEAGASIYYYVVEWDSLSWEAFRGEVLGATDPTTAPEDSLRGAILKNWKDLGLKSEPNTGDNGVHGSASPFEALAERVNWLGNRIDRDSFGRALIKAGISTNTIKTWSKDPQVTFGPIPMTKSLFDTVEDTDSDWCAAVLGMINRGTEKLPKLVSPQALAEEVKKLEKKVEGYASLETAVAGINAFMPPKKTKAKGAAAEAEKPPVRGGKGKGGKGKEEPPAKGSGKGSKGKGKAKEEPSKGKGKGKGGKSAGKGGKAGGKGKGGKGKGKK